MSNERIAKLAKSLSSSAEYMRGQAMTMNAYLKTGKVNKFLEPIAAVCEALPDTASAFTSTASGTMYLFLEINQLEGFKNDKIESLLNLFEYLGPTSTAAEDVAANLSKVVGYTFADVHTAEYGGKYFSCNVFIRITLTAKEESETCKRVVVGYTEPKEPQPIYKIECADEVSATTGE